MSEPDERGGRPEVPPSPPPPPPPPFQPRDAREPPPEIFEGEWLLVPAKSWDDMWRAIKINSLVTALLGAGLAAHYLLDLLAK